MNDDQKQDVPIILRKLAYSGWTAATKPYRELMEGVITSEEALAATLVNIESEWEQVWSEIKRIDFGLSHELSARMGPRPPADQHPLRTLAPLAGGLV